MKKFLLSILLILWPFSLGAQTCPAGTTPMPWGVTRDGTTGLTRQIFCKDWDGNIFVSNLGGTINGALSAMTMPGTGFSAKVSACNAAVVAAGGGICDARGLTGAQTLSASVNVGTSTIRVTLLLGHMTLTRSANRQIIYHNGSNIWGSGVYSTVITGNDGVPAIREAHGEGAVVNAQVKDLRIDGAGAGGSIGLTVGEVGGGFADVSSSRFENLVLYNLDTALTVGSGNSFGCTCYNTFRNVQAMGVTLGSNWLSGANSNDWQGGSSWGLTGLLVSGGLGNRFYGVDVESAATNSIHLTTGGAPPRASSGNSFFGGYLEASGPILLDVGVTDNHFWTGLGENVNPNWPAQVVDNSGNTTNHFGDHPVKLLGNYLALTGTLGNTEGLSFLWLNFTGAGGMNPNEWFSELLFGPTLPDQGGAVAGSGHHMPFSAGGLTSVRGITTAGSIVNTAVPTPNPPTLATHGVPGGTTYTYFVVCLDYNNKQTLASGPAVINTGNAILDANNYIIITPPASDGCYAYDVLKTNTATFLGKTRTAQVLNDVGQATAGYTAPTRNYTGDVGMAGQATVGLGVEANGGGFKHQSVTTGSMGAGTSAAITLTWTTAFADANYSPQCSVLEATASTVTLRLHHIQSFAAANVVVRVVNDDGAGAHTGTLYCTGVHQ